MVIEDEVEIVWFVEFYFCDLGCEVKYVESGVVGLVEVFDGVYDFIVLDFMFFEFDGFEVC